MTDIDPIQEEFLFSVGHDLKGPLTTIRGYAQMLRRNLLSPQPDLARVMAGLAVIETQSLAMTRLLNHLLDAGRIHADQFWIQRAPCDLGDCLATIVAGLGPEESQRVDVTLPDAPLTGTWDRERIEQVLANLVRNALKYSPPTTRVTIDVERGGGGGVSSPLRSPIAA